MVTLRELRQAVDAAFETESQGLSSWTDPHGSEGPAEETYSRVSDAAKYRLFGARSMAWIVALEQLGLARTQDGAPLQWRGSRGQLPDHSFEVIPVADGALPLHVGWATFNDVPDAIVHLAVGVSPAMVLTQPDCGCDACDFGSERVLESIDELIECVVTGTFRHLTSGDRQITVRGPYGWGSRGTFRGRSAERIKSESNPKGWTVTEGASWF